MNTSFYKNLTHQFNLFNRWNSNLLNKHQFVVYPIDKHANDIYFGLLLPSMTHKTRHAVEPYLKLKSLSVNNDPYDLLKDNKQDNKSNRMNAVFGLNRFLVSYLDQALTITSDFQQGVIPVDESGYKDTCENLFYIFQWYLNMHDRLLKTELCNVPSELDKRCSDIAINALKSVIEEGGLDRELGTKLIKKGNFLATFFGDVFPLVAHHDQVGLTEIVQACFNSKFDMPEVEYKNNGFAKVEFNDVFKRISEARN